MDSYCYDYQFDQLACILSDIDEKLGQLVEIEMDKKIKSIQKDTKTLAKKESELLKEDKKRDKACDMGQKMMKKKK